MSWVLAVLAGGGGALARYGISGWVQQRLQTTLPLGTAVVNLTGAAVLGLLVGLGNLSEPTARVVALGFLGGYTTFSTWVVESILMAEAGGTVRLRAGALNAIGPFVAGLAVAAAGFALGSWM